MRVILRRQPEIGVDETFWLELPAKDVYGEVHHMDCPKLKELHDVVTSVDGQLKELRDHKVKEASIVGMRGSNFRVDVRDVYEWTQDLLGLVEEEQKRCQG